MPEDLKVSQIGSSPLSPPFRGLHSPGVRKHCQIIFACYFRKSSVNFYFFLNHIYPHLGVESDPACQNVKEMLPPKTGVNLAKFIAEDEKVKRAAHRNS